MMSDGRMIERESALHPRRRGVLRVAAALTVLAALPAAPVLAAPTGWPGLVGGLLGDPRAARNIARLAMRKGLLPPSPAVNLAALRLALGLQGEGLPGPELDALRALIRARVREDFRHGRMLDLNGWQLAVTEVQACCAAL